MSSSKAPADVDWFADMLIGEQLARCRRDVHG